MSKNIIPIEKLQNMHKELKHAVRWFSRKRVILFVLFFSVSLLGGAVYMITEKNKRLKDEYEKQEVYLRQKEALERLGLHIKAAESASRGYTLTDNKAFLKDFDADTRSIYEAGQEIQYIDDSDAKQTSTSLFLQLDTFVRQKVTFMQQVNALCAANRDSAKILIASGDGVRLSDSITAASRHIITNYKQSIALLKTSFWRVKELNNNIVYYSIIISILLIILLFYFLTKEIAATRNLGELIELQKEEYRTTLGSMAEGVITTDKNGRIKYMNPSAEQITGWKKQEAKNMPLHLVYDVSSESIDEPFDNIVNRILKSGVAITLENSTLLKTRYNEELIINNSGTPLINQKKEIAGVVLVFNDITEKKKAEHALKISEQKYRNLIEQASDGIVIYSYDGIIHEFNRVAYELCGYTRHEFEKLNINEILFENKIGSDPAITEKLSKGEEVLFERTIKRKDGTTFVVEINAGKFDADRLVAFVRDISERKAAEKELAESEYNLRTIFETEPECIKLLNEKGELLNMNPAGLAMIEADNLDMVKGNSVLGVVLPQYRVAFANLVKMVFEGRTEKLEFEIEGFKGTRRWMETHAVPLKDAAGKVISLLSVTRETTERKNAEEAMQKALKRYDILTPPKIT